MFSITLNDGSKLENLSVDGSYFVSSQKIDPETLRGKLSNITVTDTSPETDDETPREYSPIGTGDFQHVKLAHFLTEKNTYQFTLKVLSPSEVRDLKTSAALAYLSMMSDIELPE